jgi:hypothetical protein
MGPFIGCNGLCVSAESDLGARQQRPALGIVRGCGKSCVQSGDHLVHFRMHRIRPDDFCWSGLRPLAKSLAWGAELQIKDAGRKRHNRRQSQSPPLGRPMDGVGRVRRAVWRGIGQETALDFSACGWSVCKVEFLSSPGVELGELVTVDLCVERFA